MKKLCMLILALALVLTMFTGCSGDTQAPADNPGTPADAAADSVNPADYSIGTIIMTVENSFQVLQGTAAEAMGKEIGFKTDVADGESSAIRQQEILANYLSQGISGTVVVPVDPGSADDMLALNKEDDVPMVFLNSEPDHDVVKSWEKCMYVGCVASDAGRMQGEILLDYFNNVDGADKNGDGVIQMVLVWGQKDIADAIARSTYSVQTLEENGWEVELIQEPVCPSWGKSESFEACTSIVSAIGPENIEAFSCNCDELALGAIEALKAVGYNTGDQSPANFVPVVGVDAVDSALQAVKDGSMLGTVKQDGDKMGKTAAKLAYLMATGVIDPNTLAEEVGVACDEEHFFWIDYTKITADNVDEFIG